jgi:hypothetical protein
VFLQGKIISSGSAVQRLFKVLKNLNAFSEPILYTIGRYITKGSLARFENKFSSSLKNAQAFYKS